MIPTLVAGTILIALIFFAVRHIYKEKKRGAKCIGCPHAGSCQKSSSIYNH